MRTLNPNKIFLGNRKPARAEAWRALPRRAKLRLNELRREGKFGGTPGRAPQWWAQNYGLASAQIAGKHYLESSVRRWRAQVRVAVAAWLRS